VNERWESWEMGQHFYADLVALDVQSSGELWSVEDTCQELWRYRIHGTTIASVAFDSSFVYVGTSYGPDQNYGEYHILCLDKKTGRERWKQTITGAVSSELVLYDSFLFFETQNYDKTYLYALQTRTGSVVESLSTPFRSFVHLNDQLCYTSIEDSKLYLHMFSLKERTFQSHVWEELGDIEWQDTEGLVKMGSLVGYALLIKDENYIESSLDDTDETKSVIRLLTYNVEKREPAWNTTIETEKLFSFFADCNYANSVLYINTWGNNGCIAFDTMTKTVKWETWIEEYALEQLNVYFGNIYVVVAPFSSGRDYIKHAQIVLELTPETGKILGTTPESRYTGIARIVGTYRNNLITQGPDNAFLEFYPVK
jgi:outer membrane protein assembly factor BamB